MKRFVKAVLISATLAAAAALPASCTWMSGDDGPLDARLTFRFTRTKAETPPDTNRFILTVCQNGADKPVYEGLYGDRPATLQVNAGTYTVSAYSCRFTAPAFDTPLFGDEKVVVARSGETVSVAFQCVRRNSGVRLEFSDRFRSKYPGKIVLRQDRGTLDYTYSEQRTACLFPGETSFCYHDGTTENVLFRRTLEEGEIRTISLDAGDVQAGSAFSIALDTTATRRWEKIVVGENTGGDGLSMATAYSPEEFATADCAGDTVWVWGYIVGTIVAEGNVDFACDTVTSVNNLAIAASPDVRTASACTGIYLSKNAHKTALNIGNPDIRAITFHRKIYVQGKSYTYKKFPAITNICDYKLE